MPTQLSDATVRVNSQVVGIDPDSLSFDTGQGTQSVRNASAAGRPVPIFSNDVTGLISMVSWTMPTTPDNIELVTDWKESRNTNTVTVSGSADGKIMTRTFNRCAFTDPVVVAIGTNGSISVTFHGDTAV